MYVNVVSQIRAGDIVIFMYTPVLCACLDFCACNLHAIGVSIMRFVLEFVTLAFARLRINTCQCHSLIIEDGANVGVLEGVGFRV